MESIISQIIDEYNTFYESANQAIGRYKGRVLIYGALAVEINNNFSTIKDELAIRGYQIVRWSSISQDEDDYNEFAVRKGFHSI